MRYLCYKCLNIYAGLIPWNKLLSLFGFENREVSYDRADLPVWLHSGSGRQHVSLKGICVRFSI